MQKTKQTILKCLLLRPTSIGKIRRYFSQTGKSTNPSDLRIHLKALEKNKCIVNNSGDYHITPIGRKLLNLLQEVSSILN